MTEAEVTEYTATCEVTVARGMAFLDRREPGWEHKVDLAALELADGCRCVLGQVGHELMLTKGYEPVRDDHGQIEMYRSTSSVPDGPRVLTSYNMLASLYEAEDRDWEAHRHGFLKPAHPGGGSWSWQTSWDAAQQAWAILDEVWIREIKRRFDTGVLSDA